MEKILAGFVAGWAVAFFLAGMMNPTKPAEAASFTIGENRFTAPTFTRWEIRSTDNGNKAAALAAAGWEPYAVVDGYRASWRMYLRRVKP